MLSTRRGRAAAWITSYSLVALLPLFFMILFPLDAPREWWREFSVAVGFVGAAMLGMQLVLTARIPALDEPFGADLVYRFHHQISIATFGMMLLHPVLLFGVDLFSSDPTIGYLKLLNVFTAPWRARFALLSVVAAIVLVVISVWRLRLKITNYVAWRISHGFLGILAYAAGLTHMLLVNKYMANAPIRWLFLCYAAVTLGILVYARIVRPLQLRKNPWEVVSVKAELGSVYSLRLKPRGKGLEFEPGQYAWITAWRGPLANAQHPFSFSSSADDDTGIEFAIKELGDFTATIKELKPGDTVYVEGPYGGFSPERCPDASALVLVPGGIGISPMMSILRTMVDRGDQRPAILLYGNYDSATAAFRQEIKELEPKLNLTVRYVLENPSEGEDCDKGYITTEVLDRYIPAGTARMSCHVFVCGPAVMMNAIEKSCLGMGLPLAQIHSERFDLV